MATTSIIIRFSNGGGINFANVTNWRLDERWPAGATREEAQERNEVYPVVTVLFVGGTARELTAPESAEFHRQLSEM